MTQILSQLALFSLTFTISFILFYSDCKCFLLANRGYSPINMLVDFFKLNNQPSLMDQNAFLIHFQTGDSLLNVQYNSPELNPGNGKYKFRSMSFTNVSFSKTLIKNVIFTECAFTDCLFIGTSFDDCEFHDCVFKGCNPYKVKFTNTYIDPNAFKNLLDRKKYSNIGVHLFHELLENSVSTKQPEFTHIAEYYFRKWKRFQLDYEYKTHKLSRFNYHRKRIPDLLYDVLAGYGLLPSHFLGFSVILFLILMIFNYLLWSSFKLLDSNLEQVAPNFIKSFYYTINIISTSGYVNITPSSACGMIIAGVESLLGILWLSILASIIIKRVVK